MTSKRFDGRVVIVTGAAEGIGAATAKLFAEGGAKVVLADIDAERGEQRVHEIGAGAVFRKTNVTKEDEVAALVDFACAQFGRLDCLVNNAGAVGPVGSITDVTESAWEKTIAVNLKSVFLGMKHAARVMIPNRSGVIVSTASSAGLLGGLGPHVYTAAKHGVVGLTKSVASELAQWGIRVNAVAPGGTRTNMLANAMAGKSAEEDVEAADKAVAAMSPFRRAGLPRDIAEAICFLASDAAGYMTAQTLLIDGAQSLPTNGSLVHSQAYAERL